MNVLFIGNSYTYFHDLPAVFAALANENGRDVIAHSVTRGGRKLCQFTDTEDDCTKELAAVLSEHPPYDAVFLQEQSLLPYRDYEAFFSGAKHVADTVRAAGAKRLLFYVTWGRKPGCPTLDEMGQQVKASGSLSGCQLSVLISCHNYDTEKETSLVAGVSVSFFFKK